MLLEELDFEYEMNVEPSNRQKPKVYIAGPMSGLPELNHPAFFEVAEAFEEGGWEVFNPAELDETVYGNVENTIKAMEEDRKTFLRAALNADLSWICKEADCLLRPNSSYCWPSY